MNKKILILVTLFILLMVVAPSIVRYKDEKEREEKENEVVECDRSRKVANNDYDTCNYLLPWIVECEDSENYELTPYKNSCILKDRKEAIVEKENGEMNISCPEGYIRVLSNEIVTHFENIEFYCKPESMKDKELEVWGGYVIRRCPEGYYPFNEKYCSKKDTGEYHNYNPIYNHDASPR
ncbi:MAG: hypothetical protein E7159_04800 [Firmicutes bacterium]|nr:hypothetical protein [Bacillota bacterium]